MQVTMPGRQLASASVVKGGRVQGQEISLDLHVFFFSFSFLLFSVQTPSCSRAVGSGVFLAVDFEAFGRPAGLGVPVCPECTRMKDEADRRKRKKGHCTGKYSSVARVFAAGFRPSSFSPL